MGLLNLSIKPILQRCMKKENLESKPSLLDSSTLTQYFNFSIIFFSFLGSIYIFQGQLLEGVECYIYLYCFTFDDINLNRAFVIIVLFPKKNIAIRKCVQMI